MAPTEITRRGLYDLVWSKPMTLVAEEFGMSDTALKKICDKHGVPSPPRGYWAKKQTDKPVKQIRFVNTADPRDERIVIHGGRKLDLPEPVKKVPDEARSSWSKAVVATRPIRRATEEGIRKAVVATAKALRRAKPDNDGAVFATGEGTCGIAVGNSSVERVISILDVLANSLEGRGLDLVPNAKNMSVALEGQIVTLSISG
jgi:hypothetical protein